MTPATDALDDLSLRLAELETTAMRAGEALRAANRRIAELTDQREAILIGMTISFPPLPEPEDYIGTESGPVGIYTAEHMRAYSIAVAQAVIEACCATCAAQLTSAVVPTDMPMYHNTAVIQCLNAIRALQVEQPK